MSARRSLSISLPERISQTLKYSAYAAHDVLEVIGGAVTRVSHQ
jgi:hypothetical protein